MEVVNFPCGTKASTGLIRLASSNKNLLDYYFTVCCEENTKVERGPACLMGPNGTTTRFPQPYAASVQQH